MARSSGWLAAAVLAAWTIAHGAADGGQTHAASPAGPRAPSPGVVTVLQGARVTTTADGIVVAIDASGPLPFPSVGTARDPSRIYIDLANVRPAARFMSARGSGVVRSIRAAVNSVQPLVTRVVIELESEVPYQVDVERRELGRMSITLESGDPSERVTVLQSPDRCLGSAVGSHARRDQRHDASPGATRRASGRYTVAGDAVTRNALSDAFAPEVVTDSIIPERRRPHRRPRCRRCHRPRCHIPRRRRRRCRHRRRHSRRCRHLLLRHHRRHNP